MSTFTSILNRGCKGAMTLEIGFYFVGYFFNSFYRSSLSPNFSFDLTSELEPPTSPKDTNLFARGTMRRAKLREILVTFLPDSQISLLLHPEGYYN
jgi:hypothetical protein